eukprot:gnl/MRDRNA2_/MRDRNA2_95404_c0_seq1.p1 gnl/MRDRNA2_/MRDRNA2_95404_c0~~gnl/MRDRNA2_/MRDRNA2_95404_c0_seq1.p1  ORF type:complete len:292 (-),score=45.25 gnl/MRDRNA2_/MRDRNA2_95404_c0_seq1:206-970(-)
MENLSSVELLSLLKTRYETRRREVPAIDENEGQQLITDFFQNQSKDAQDNRRATDSKTMMWQSPRKRAQSPTGDASCKTIPPVPLFSVESPVKPKRTRPLRLRLKLKTPVKSPAKKKIPSLVNSPLKTKMTLTETRTSSIARALVENCSSPAVDLYYEDKENCNPVRNSVIDKEATTAAAATAVMKSVGPVVPRKNSVLAEMINVVQKVKREARQAKENTAQNRSLECERGPKRRCVSLEFSRPCKAPQKGLRV